MIIENIIFVVPLASKIRIFMKEISMVDLKSQYGRIKPEIDDAIRSVINSTAFIRGKDVKLFEDELAEYLGVRNVIGCGNGTDALQIAMMGLGLKPGDEVITTNFTFIATVETIALLGLKPVFVDPDPKTFNISPEEVEKSITDKTKVILPVHLFGQCADMEKLTALAKKHHLYIIEDTAQATGSEFTFKNGSVKKAGTIGNIGTTSFFPSKNLGCYGDGGALFTDDDELAKQIRSVINHGMTKKYYHDYIGVNSRLDTIQAAILRVKLNHLDSYNNARQAVADAYDKAFMFTRGITSPYRCNNSTHIFHQYTLKTEPEDRDALKEHLSLNNIPSMVYYPVPLHKQKAYQYLGYTDDKFPVTEELSKRVLSLPMHTEFEDQQVNYITEKVNEFFEEI